MPRLAFAVLPILAALALAGSEPARAQQDDNSAPTQIARAAHTLAAIWRPITTTTQAALTAACAGATDDLNALEAAIPQQLSNTTLATVRVAHGLVFVPTDENPAEVFVFPDPSMAWLASGVAVIRSADEETGEVALEDANGQAVHLLLGHVAGQLLMRLATPGGQDITYAGCASTLDQPAPARGTPG